MRNNTKSDAPELLYIMYCGSLVNGVILQGFDNASAYPGEPIQVRGDAGMDFEHALTLVNNQQFCWCDAGGTPLADAPEPTEAEAAATARLGADLRPDIPREAYPPYHFRDAEYKPPSVRREEAMRAANLPGMPPAEATSAQGDDPKKTVFKKSSSDASGNGSGDNGKP
jgi:hypothetical protein